MYVNSERPEFRSDTGVDGTYKKENSVQLCNWNKYEITYFPKEYFEISFNKETMVPNYPGIA